MTSQKLFNGQYGKMHITSNEDGTETWTVGNSVEYPPKNKTLAIDQTDKVIRDNAVKTKILMDALVEISLSRHDYKDIYHEICFTSCPRCIAEGVLKKIQE